MLTTEEQRELDGLELEKLLAEKAQWESDNAGPPERTWGQAARDVGTDLTQGASWNWGDEFTSAVAAGGAKLAGDERGYGDIYGDILGAENARMRQHREDRPGEALAAELVGGLLTRRPRPKAAIDKVLRRSTKVAKKKALKEAEKSPVTTVRQNLTRNVGGGALEGAVAGAGYDHENRGRGAAFGGVIGTAIPGGLNLARQTARTVGRRRIAKEMGRGEDYLNPALAEEPGESWAGDFYREWLGTAIPSRSIMAGQQRRYMGALDEQKQRAVQAMDDVIDEGKLDKKAAKVLRRTLKSQKKTERATVKDDYTAQRDDLEQKTWGKADEIDAAAERQVAGMEATPAAVARKNNRQLQQETATESLPAHAKDLREQVAGMPPQQAAKKIDKWWYDEGFQMVKKEEFKWEKGEVFDNLRIALAEDPRMALEVGQIAETIPALAARIQKFATAATGAKGVVKGNRQFDPRVEAFIAEAFRNPTHIGGEAFMALRNVFAIKANKTGSSSLRKIVKQFDKAIRAGLKEADDTGKLTERFNAEIRHWPVSRRFGDTVYATRKKGGDFDSSDWLGQTKGREAKYGEAPFQAQAGAYSKANQQAQDAAKEGVAGLKSSVSKGKTELGRKGQKLRRTLNQKEKNELAAINDRIDGDPRLTGVERKAEKLDARKTLLARSLREQREEISKLKQRGIVKKPSGYKTLLYSTLTNLFPGSGSMLASAPGGRFIGGQTGWQKKGQAANKWLTEQRKLAELADRARSSAIREYGAGGR